MWLFDLLRVEKRTIRLRFANDRKREMATAEVMDLEVAYWPWDGACRMFAIDESVNKP